MCNTFLMAINISLMISLPFCFPFFPQCYPSYFSLLEDSNASVLPLFAEMPAILCGLLSQLFNVKHRYVSRQKALLPPQQNDLVA